MHLWYCPGQRGGLRLGICHWDRNTHVGGWHLISARKGQIRYPEEALEDRTKTRCHVPSRFSPYHPWLPWSIRRDGWSKNGQPDGPQTNTASRRTPEEHHDREPAGFLLGFLFSPPSGGWDLQVQYYQRWVRICPCTKCQHQVTDSDHVRTDW